VVGGKEGRFVIEGVEGRVVGLEMLGKLPAPPSDGRDPPIDGSPLGFPPKLGFEGRVLAFPSEGRDTLGALGRDMFGILGLDMFGILGRTPPPPTCPIDGLAPPPPRPPPPPLPRCAKAVGNQTIPIIKVAATAAIMRMFFVVNMVLAP
jgi:hypothetical protein